MRQGMSLRHRIENDIHLCDRGRHVLSAASALLALLLAVGAAGANTGTGTAANDDLDDGIARLNLHPTAQLLHLRVERALRRRRRLELTAFNSTLVVDEEQEDDEDDDDEILEGFARRLLDGGVMGGGGRILDVDDGGPKETMMMMMGGVYVPPELVLGEFSAGSDWGWDGVMEGGDLLNVMRAMEEGEVERRRAISRHEALHRNRERSRALRTLQNHGQQQQPPDHPEEGWNHGQEPQSQQQHQQQQHEELPVVDAEAPPPKEGLPVPNPEDEMVPDDVDVDVPPPGTQPPPPGGQSQQQQPNNPNPNGGPPGGTSQVVSGGMMSSETYQIAPLLQGYGTHYATAWVGTPSQRKSVIVDTGSHYTAFPCVGCVDCGEEHHTDKYFDPGASSTFEVVDCKECSAAVCSQQHQRCEFSQSYTEGSSWHAYQVRDRYYIGGNDPATAPYDPIDQTFAIPFMFGCQTSETGLFRTQLADGIMGMSAHEATLAKQMFNAKKLRRNMFSLCFRRELSVSKSGVLAGVLTLGGFDTRLNSSPMVFAKNVSPKGGWYTVYVRSVSLLERTVDPSEAVVINGSDKVHPVQMNVAVVNNGKGVIVDSGTTDTYLSSSMKTQFDVAWKAATGGKWSYHNNAMKLTKDQVMSLPTVLVQLQAFDSSPNDGMDPDTIAGLAGTTIDQKNPHDVLVAIPPLHYLEYSPSKNTYTSRLYFTESKGGVLGANAMQGHDILFDWENGRIGFAKSTCDHNELVNNKEKGIVQTEGGQVGDEGSVVDCVLSKPSISVTCEESVDKMGCEGVSPAQNKILQGYEKWLRVIETDSSPMGKGCEDVAKSLLKDHPEATAECNKQGLCFEIRPCTVPCSELASTGASAPKEVVQETHDEEGPKETCGDNLFGACQSSCTQSKVVSVLMDDGKCHATENVITRPCHIGLCGRDNPCLVPFVIHVIFGFSMGNSGVWDKYHEDVFGTALSNVINAHMRQSSVGASGIGPGDVNILMASQWRDADETADVNMPPSGDNQDENQGQDLGMKLVAEISVFNPELANVASSGGEAVAPITCQEEDLYEYAQVALQMHQIFQNVDFLQNILDQTNEITKGMSRESSGNAVQSPFESVDGRRSKVLTSWTIKTEVGVADPSSPEASDDPNSFSSIIHNIQENNATIPVIAVGLAVILFILSLGAYVGYRLEARRELRQLRNLQTHSSTLIERMRERTNAMQAEKERGAYAPIDTNGDGDMHRKSAIAEIFDEDDDGDGDVELA